MCNCASCKLTDSYAEKGFDAWPKGEGIRRSGKDKVYAAHWAFCGAEAHKRPEKFDVRMRLGGKFIPLSTYKDLPHYAPFYTGAKAWDEGIAWGDESC